MSTSPAISSIRFAFGACAVLAAAALAIAALIGNVVDSPLLTSLVPGLPAMKPNAALVIIAAAASWLLLQSGSRGANAIGLFLAALVAAAAAATLVEHLFSIDLGIDNLLLRDRDGALTGHPGRMSAATCVALLLASLALALTRPMTERAEDVRQLARLIGLAITLFALALHVYDSTALAVVRGFESTALNTSLGLALVLLAIGFDRSTASLRWQVAHVGVVVVAPLAALTVHFASAERDIALENAGARLASIARLGGERQDSVIAQTRQMLEFVARSPAVRGSTSDCWRELADYLPISPQVRALYTVGPDGQIRCADRVEFKSVFVKDRDYVRRALESGEFTVSGYILSRSSGQPRVVIALPFKGAADERMLIAASLDVSALGGPLERLAEGPGARAATITLVDKNGVLLARSPANGAQVGANLADATFVTQALASPGRPFEAAELDGAATVFVADRVLNGQGTLIVGLPKAKVVGPVDSRLNRRLFLISLILAISLALGVFAGETLVLRPLRRLIAYARRLEEGDLAARPDVRHASGEVGALGRALAVTATAIEDRERRLVATEALFRGLFDHSPDAKIVVRVEPNEEFRIETWNAAATLFSGLTPTDVVGRRPRDVFPGSRGETIERDLRRVLSLARVVTVEREPTMNGAPTVFELVQVPLLSAEGRIERIFLSARDISERKRVERLKNEFVSTVSHELRTPLTSIAGSLGLLSGGAAGPLSEKARHLIAIAHSNSLRLVRLINDILDIEKIEAGRMTFDLKTLVVSELVEQAIVGLRGYADDFGVAVEALPGGETLMARGDADRLTQVFTNLLSNAIKFSPRGETVTIAVAAEGDGVSITVTDRGPGIPETFRPRVFSKFAQADGSDARRKGGTGLGLAIVREIVEKHAGAVSYDTTVGAGTAFKVRLPRHQLGRRDPSVFAGEKPDHATILVCEDDLLIATILAEQMRDAGFEAVTVGTVRAALQAIETHEIDAVLVDLNLPDGDGIGLIRDFRASPKASRIPIIVVSADADRGRQDARAAALDVTAWLEKPVDTMRLASLLQRRLKPIGDRPRILHVEDDADLCNVVSAALAPLADVVSVGSVSGARRELEKSAFDLAIIDIALEDGSGLDLLAQLENSSPRRIPAVVFSARDITGAEAGGAEAAITKSRTSLSTLVDTIRHLIERSKEEQDASGSARATKRI